MIKVSQIVARKYHIFIWQMFKRAELLVRSTSGAGMQGAAAGSRITGGEVTAGKVQMRRKETFGMFEET